MKRILSGAIVPLVLCGSGYVSAQADRAQDAARSAAPQVESRGGGQVQTPGGSVQGRAGTQVNPPRSTDARGELQTPAGDAQGGVRSRTEPQPGTRIGGRADVPPAPAPADGGAPDARISGRASGSAQGSARADMSNRPALGVTLDPRADGVIITNVAPGSPAFRSGLRAGDRIVTLNGTAHASPNAFIDAFGVIGMDADGEIVYLRNGQEFTTTFRPAYWNDVFVQSGVAQPYSTLRPDFDATQQYAPAAPIYGGNVQYGAPQVWYPNGGYRWSAWPRRGFFFGNRGFDDDDCFDD